MPPKKDDKKGKGAKAAKKEVDSSAYIRPAVALPDVDPAVVPQEPLSGKIANVELLFPEWEVAGENWSEALPPEAAPPIEYPSHIEVAEYKAVKAFLGLEDEAAAAPVDPKAKKPPAKDAKKGAPTGGDLEELAVDEAGRALPRMFLGSADESQAEAGYLAQPTTDLFRREYSDAQKTAKQELAALELAAAEEARLLAESPKGGEGGESADDASAALLALEQAAAAAAQAVSDYTTANAALLTSAPAGAEVDPHMCAAFHIVARFAPALLSTAAATATTDPPTPTASGPMQYLWRSIYPKLPSGRPCFNAAGGRYCVRLYLGGKWRKVAVTDAVPLDSRGRPAVASSAQPLELWPMILSKAVYAVYAAAGYSRSLRDVSATVKSAHLVAFATHALTGWMPSSPWLVAPTLGDGDGSRLRGILEGMAFGGALNIKPAAVPTVDPPSPGSAKNSNPSTVGLGLEREPQPPSADNGEGESKGGASPTPALRTAKYFQEVYKRKQADRIIQETDIAHREALIAQINESLRSAFGEGFVIVRVGNDGRVGLSGSGDGGNGVDGTLPLEGEDARGQPSDAPTPSSASASTVTVDPVLAVSFVAEDGSPLPLSEVRLLCAWSCLPLPTPPQPIKLTPAELAAESLVDRMRREEPPLPASTPLIMRWVTVGELARGNAAVVSFDTGKNTMNKAALGWHWKAPVVAVDPKAAAGKGAKGAGAAAAAEPSLGAGAVCTDPGTLPPVLLKVETTKFFVSATTDPGLDSEAQAAIDAQADTLAEASEQGGGVPVLRSLSSHLSLSVAIHGDLEMDGDGDSASAGEAGGRLNSDVVLVLQEVRIKLRGDGSDDPLVMRVELGRFAGLPLTRQTFHIPADRVNTTEPMVFWVRLFTTASVYLTFGCGVPIETGEAESIWASIGHSCLVRSGESGATLAEAEQMVLRVPLKLAVSTGAAAAAGGAGTAAAEGAEEEVADLALSFLHISDRSTAHSVTTALVGDGLAAQTEQGFVFPRIEGNLLPVSSTVPRMLLARASGHHGQALPPFSWKVVILSRRPLIDPVAPVAVGPVTSRFSGKYTPNRDLVLFRDVMAVDMNSFPLALRLTCGYLEGQVAALAAAAQAARAAAKGELRILLRRCSNLMNSDAAIAGKSDPYIRLWTGENEESRVYAQSRRIDNSLNPEFNEQHCLPWDGRSRLFLQVWDDDVNKTDESLGELAIPLASFDFSKGDALKLVDATLQECAHGTVSLDVSFAAAAAAVPETDGGGDNVVLNLKQDIALRLNAYRKSDRKLVGSYRGQGIMQVYNIAIHGFLADGEAPPEPVPLAAADPKAKAPAKKDDKKGAKGGGAAGVEGIEVLLELCIDEEATKVPRDWRSKMPYVFSKALATEGSSDPSVSNDPSEHGRLISVPPVSPQFTWNVDVLAGVVNDLRSDTAALERQAEIKNGWEDASEGRAAKAVAALALYQERQRLKLANQEDRSVAAVPEAVVELLATALEKEAEELRLRESILVKASEYKEYTEPFDPSSGPATIVSEEARIAAKALRDARQQQSEEQAKRNVERFTTFNEGVRVTTKLRTQALVDAALEDARQAAEVWKLRENYRAFANSQNDTLRWILDRAAAAIEKCVVEEDPAAAAAAAKAKGAKKK